MNSRFARAPCVQIIGPGRRGEGISCSASNAVPSQAAGHEADKEKEEKEEKIEKIGGWAGEVFIRGGINGIWLEDLPQTSALRMSVYLPA